MSLGWLLGRKKSKKERLRETLAENKARGRAAERQFVLGQEIWGNKVARSPKGQDYIVKEYDMWTGRYKTVRIEIKSGNAKPSKLQLETKKRHPRNYKIKRVDPIFY